LRPKVKKLEGENVFEIERRARMILPFNQKKILRFIKMKRALSCQRKICGEID